MSSVLHAKLLTERRANDRAGMARPSTMRGNEQIPIDIIIEDLSCGGCRVSGDLGLAVDDRVTIGLPGIGACAAQVVWSGGGGTGLEFDRGLTGHDIDIARETDTLVDGHFGLVIRDTPEPLHDGEREILSVRRRVGVIAASAICAWGIAITAVWMAVKLF
ncbi:PilZ domain-containing protein [Sphingobium sp. CR2-8]|uniref:PilZ domain-containing protein n=1 Tax=Sphingobium sp. CR2-8 TaxID=1306534 RepID=UPI002DB95F9B|nr:PilZ domain-containing protein [Sphingobium sp. CR2-8]MEC3912825.1 PilZ domain-containing protein [Sphingobium sp. CR2-8]